MISRFERFSVALSVLSRCLHRIEEDEMEQYGLKGSFAIYLAALSRYPDGVPAARLCEICEKDKAAVSRTVSEMEKHGLLCRDGDSYRAMLRLTDMGWRAANHVSSRAQTAVDLAGQDMTESERAAFYGALERIAARMQDICKDGLPQKGEQDA